MVPLNHSPRISKVLFNILTFLTQYPYRCWSFFTRFWNVRAGCGCCRPLNSSTFTKSSENIKTVKFFVVFSLKLTMRIHDLGGILSSILNTNITQIKFVFPKNFTVSPYFTETIIASSFINCWWSLHTI